MLTCVNSTDYLMVGEILLCLNVYILHFLFYVYMRKHKFCLHFILLEDCITIIFFNRYIGKLEI